jgi:hypothetical protein
MGDWIMKAFICGCLGGKQKARLWRRSAEGTLI